MSHILTNLTTSHQPFISSHPKNVICTVHSTSCYELNRHTLILTISSSNIIILIIHQHDKFTTDINTLIPNILHHFFLNSAYCIKNTNLQGILRNFDPITQVYIFCPFTKTFNVDESRPLISPFKSRS